VLPVDLIDDATDEIDYAFDTIGTWIPAVGGIGGDFHYAVAEPGS
jgi:hypothetical protein